MTTMTTLRAAESSGRPVGRVAGGWISDITALKQTVLLCPACTHKFNPRRHGYEVWRDFLALAKCDDCHHYSSHTKVYVHESREDSVRLRRRRGRWVTHAT